MKPARVLLVSAVVVAASWAALTRPWAMGPGRMDQPWPAPEFTHEGESDWINSRPLRLANLEGRVVLVDFWTYGCWNCKRSFPFIREIQSEFGREGLVVVGVHTPEFKHEMSHVRVREHVRQFDLDHPVMVDNDFSYWNAMNNRYWPTFYLIDKSGRVRERVVGEIRPGDDRARDLELRIRTLLAETT